MARRPKTESRIDRILGIMRLGLFEAKHRKALAKEWGVGEDRVTDLACEARRKILAEEFTPESVKADVAIVMREIVRTGHRSRDAKRQSNAIKAADVLVTLVGANAPKQIEVSLDEIVIKPDVIRERVRSIFGANAAPADAGHGADEAADPGDAPAK